jgi:hypothetical protein
MGSFLGRRMFLTTMKLESVGKKLLEYIKLDMLRYMTTEVRRAALLDYNEQAKKTATWKPTWFEKQIILLQQIETKEEEPQGKRKKTQQPTKQTKSEQNQTWIHLNHTQQATKILSAAAMNTAEKMIITVEKLLASLQEDNVELAQTIGEMKNSQYQDQVKMVALQSELEANNCKLETASQDIKKCK